MDGLLDRLDQALRDHAADLHRRLLAGLSEGALREAETTLGRPLPNPLATLLRWRDGQRGKGTFPAGPPLDDGFLLGLSRALDTRTTLLGKAGGGRFDDAWLPLVARGDGDHLVVDLGSGAVLHFQHERPEVPEVAPSVEAWIEGIVTRLEGQGASSLSTQGAGSGAPPIEIPATDWDSLRGWLRQARDQDDASAFYARIALASGPLASTDEHPAMAGIRSAVEAWLASPSATTRQALSDAVTARSRTYVPRNQVVVAVQLAGEAALADSTARACDLALQAVAKAEPTVVDGTATDLMERCQELQRKLAAL